LRSTLGKEIEFDRLREETWDLPFIEKHYRSVVKQLKEEGRRDHACEFEDGSWSEKRDRVRFLPPKEGGST
jgi:hypothetical protein